MIACWVVALWLNLLFSSLLLVTSNSMHNTAAHQKQKQPCLFKPLDRALYSDLHQELQHKMSDRAQIA